MIIEACWELEQRKKAKRPAGLLGLLRVAYLALLKQIEADPNALLDKVQTLQRPDMPPEPTAVGNS